MKRLIGTIVLTVIVGGWSCTHFEEEQVEDLRTPMQFTLSEQETPWTDSQVLSPTRIPLACEGLDSLNLYVSTEEWPVAGVNREPSVPVHIAKEPTPYELEGELPHISDFTPDTRTLEEIVVEVRAREREETRGALVETFADTYDAFGLFTYAYEGAWSESCTSKYMHNVKILQNGSTYAPEVNFYWPAPIYHVRFFAYAPYIDEENTNISLETDGNDCFIGEPKITFIPHPNVAEQQDFVVAQTEEQVSTPKASQTIAFKHALTAIQFKVGTLPAGTISRIVISGVKREGTYSMKSESWSLGSALATGEQAYTYAFSPAFTHNGTAGATLTPANGVFMLLPQTIPAGAKIQVTYTEKVTGNNYTLTGDIGGQVWAPGKLITYTISSTGISITPTLSAKFTSGSSIAWSGGNVGFEVTSYATLKEYSTTKTVPLAWHLEFQLPGETIWHANPGLIDVTGTFSGNGGQTKQTCTFNIGAQKAAFSNNKVEDAAVLQPTDGSGYTDLSLYNVGTVKSSLATKMTTANCYVVNAPGKYRFPLIYGNAISQGATNERAYIGGGGTGALTNFKNHDGANITSPFIESNKDSAGALIKVSKAQVAWTDELDIVRVEGIKTFTATIDGASKSVKYVCFEVPQETIAPGNAVICVKNASGKIVWSWHIWITDTKLSSCTKLSSVIDGTTRTWYALNRNLGWTDATDVTYAKRTIKARVVQDATGLVSSAFTITQTAHSQNRVGNGCYYQWGRKDPVLPGSYTQAEVTASSGGKNKTCYGPHKFTAVTGPKNIAYSIQYPHYFIGAGSSSTYKDWCSQNYRYNRWRSDLAKAYKPNSEGTSNRIYAIRKTVYDPCPPGYGVPPWTSFRHFYRSSSHTGSAFRSNGSLRCYAIDGSTSTYIELPYTGDRNRYTGVVWQDGIDSGYWMNSVAVFESSGVQYAQLFMFDSDSKTVHAFNGEMAMSSGYSVRPVQGW